MKKSLTILGVVIGAGLIALFTLNRASAATIAIIDTSVNSSQVKNIVHEVCFTTNASCAGNTLTAEGTGAANILPGAWSILGINHGTEVAETALQANPNVKIVFIRITDTLGSNGYNGTLFMHTSQSSLDQGLAWVAKNYKQYGIQDVTISQELKFSSGSCPTDTSFTSFVESLKNNNVPVFAGAGNDGLQNNIAWPACSNDVISVGAASDQGSPLYFSNLGPSVKLMSLGSLTVPLPTNATGTAITPTRVAGTSMASPWAATLWATNYTGTWQQQVNNLQKLPIVTDKYGNKYPFLM